MVKVGFHELLHVGVRVAVVLGGSAGNLGLGFRFEVRFHAALTIA